MRTGNCELCGHWDSALTLGVCGECINRHNLDTPPGPTLPAVIGIAGRAGAGKDTAADFITERLPLYEKASFADPLKAMLETGLGLNAAQLYGGDKGDIDARYECTPRHIMQTLGTEWGRELIHPDVWVRAMAERVKGRRVVIADVRFPNEAAFVRERGLLIHVVGRGGIDGGHVSEVPVTPIPADITIRNLGSIEELHEEIANALSI